MRTIVSIIGGYAPDFSPGGKIASNVLDVLKEDYNVIIISRKTKFGLPEYEETNGIKLIRVADYNYMFHSLFETRKRESSGLKKAIYKFLLLCKKAVNFLVRIMRKRSLSGTYTKRIMRQLKAIERSQKIDVLIPVSAPHEAVDAAVKYKKKHPETILIPYKLDRFAQGNSLYENKYIRKVRYPRHIKSEKKTLIYADAMFALPPIYDYYKKSNFEFKEKVIKTEHPLLKRINLPEETGKNDRIELVYAGSLDVTLRNPQYLLETFSEMNEFRENYCFNVYSFGNCGHILEKYKKILGDSLNDGGKIPSKDVEGKLLAADILITIGNNSNEEVPSKLFDYLSYGKPIIHFYYSDNDAYIEYLKNYELSLCVKMDAAEKENNIKLIKEFCEKNKDKRLDFAEVSKFFEDCTPEYTAAQFDDAIKSIDTKYYASVIVAHPNQQHSMKLATALKKNNLLHTYITTVFYNDKTILEKILKLFGKNFSAKMNRKRNTYIEPNCKVFCEILGYLFYFVSRINYGLSRGLYKHLTKKFGKKVAKYAIKNNCKAVVMYDYTAVKCFEILEKKAPDIIRILDVSSIPSKSIRDIISEETRKGYGKYFSKSLQRYSLKHSNYFSKEMELAHFFLSPSDFVDSCIMQNTDAKGKIYRASYGVNTDDFVYKQRIAKETDTVNFVFTGRIEAAKGIFYLLEACDELYKIRQDFTLNLVGSDKIGKHHFESRDYLKWHGWLKKEELIDLYKSMHIFVLPSLWEGMSQSTLEAISNGIGAICSERAGIDSSVIDNRAVIVVPASDAHALAEVMGNILADKTEVLRLSENCAMFDKDISWEKYYKDVATAVSEMLENFEKR